MSKLLNTLKALGISNKRIDELEKYNLDLVNESFHKSKRIEELESMLESRTKEVDSWIAKFDKAVSKQRLIIQELEKERDEAVILAEQRRQFIVNGEDLGYISVPTSENDKAYHIFMQCGVDNSYALQAHNLEQQAKALNAVCDYAVQINMPNSEWVEHVAVRQIQSVSMDLRKQAASLRGE